MKRRIFSTILTLALGVSGGAIGARMFPANQPLPSFSTKPALASEIHVTPPMQGDGVADLVEKCSPAVVNIDTVQHRTVAMPQFEMFRDFFDQAPGGQQMQPQQQEVLKGIGSGFIIRDDGLIVTNNHVVKGAEKLTVTLANGKKYPGRVLGADPGTDLAVVKIDAKNLPTLQLADPKSLRVGEDVVAMGSPLGLSQTVTAGILSAINRNISLNARVAFLQTDAAINPGNSGGPLLNIRGQVIGVNTAIARDGQGIGFAIPVDTLDNIVPQLEAKGHVDRAWLGVGVANLPEDKSQMFYPVDHGVLVGTVEANGPAAQAGLRRGDIIESLDGQALDNAATLIQKVGGMPVGSDVSLLVNRSGQEKTFHLHLGKMPAKLADASPDQNGEGN